MTGTVRPSLWLLMFIGLVASGAAPLAAQSDAGGVRVLVVDSSSAVIPGANVTLKNLGDAISGGWTLEWDFAGNQRITNGWSVVWSQTGTM